MDSMTRQMMGLGLLALLSGTTHAADPPTPPMSFFVATSADGSANLGGLSGADRRCQVLATEAGSKGLTWRAYLSAAGAESAGRIDARDRIGRGPWYNARGALVARSVEELHSDLHGIDVRTALNARGQRAERAPHDILTGSDASGRLVMNGDRPATCRDWTSDNGDYLARVGHDDRMDASSHGNPRFRHWNGSWNDEHDTQGCSATQLAETGGGGGFYCFALDGSRTLPPETAADAGRYTFKRGVNVNHWLGDNMQLEPREESMFYADPWFTEEDVNWIADHGYDHIRVWVAGNRWVDSNGMLDEAMLTPFNHLLRWTQRKGLGVVLVMHGLPGYRSGVRFTPPPRDESSPFTDEVTRKDAAYLWWLVAQRYRDVGQQLRFDLLGYPSATSAEQIRIYTADTLAAIRRLDRKRIVYVTTRNSSANFLADIGVDDPHVALTVSFFDPPIFTRQFDSSLPKVLFPGRVPDFKTLLGADAPQAAASNAELTVEKVIASVDKLALEAQELARGREIYISTFGTLGAVDPASAKTWLRTVRAAFERHGFGWAVYDYFTGGAVRGGMNSGLGYGEGEATHVHEALFSPEG